MSKEKVKLATLLLEHGHIKEARTILEDLTKVAHTKQAKIVPHPKGSKEEPLYPLHFSYVVYKILAVELPDNTLVRRRGPRGKGTKVEATFSEIDQLIQEIKELDFEGDRIQKNQIRAFISQLEVVKKHFIPILIPKFAYSKLQHNFNDDPIFQRIAYNRGKSFVYITKQEKRDLLQRLEARLKQWKRLSDDETDSLEWDEYSDTSDALEEFIHVLKSN